MKSSKAAKPLEMAPPPSGTKRIFLLDTMSYIFRAYHALPRLTNRNGLVTHAVYGLNNMLRKLLADYQPEYVAAAYDLAGPTFRHESFADYKANREEMPDELAAQLPYIRRLIDAFRIPIVSHEGYEADDVIGTLAKQGTEQGFQTLIISSDKDMLQLVGDRVCIINPMKDNLVCDREKVVELMGVGPERITDVMALIGDAIDNIPGAPGIGDKGARDLIQKYGSVEATLDHAAEVSRKNYREALLNYRDQILLSKQLATIHSSVPISVSLEDLRRQEPDWAKLRELYQELGFTTLLKDLPVVVENEKKDYTHISNVEELRALLARLPLDRAVAVAVSGGEVTLQTDEAEKEQTLELTVTKPLEVGLSAEKNVARAVPLELLGGMKAWLEDSRIRKSVHDAKSARIALLAQRITLDGVEHDTMLYSYLLEPTAGKYEIGSVVERDFGASPPQDANEAADWTGQLASSLPAEIREWKLESVYSEMELPLVPILAEMEQAGVRIDAEQLQQLSARLDTELETLRKDIFKLTGAEFNINSPKQLGEVLFGKLGLPQPRKYGKGKVASTAVDVLEELAKQHEAPRRVLDYRQLAKLKSTYIDVLPQLRDPATGRIHTSYNQAGTSTGRISSNSPNLQNIPIRTELGREIRAAFIADEGSVLLSADYSQIELRLLAHFSDDPLLVEAFRREDDIHELTAEAVFHVPAKEQTAEHRRRAKAVNYGIVYGISPYGLAQQLGVTMQEAHQFIEEYFSRYQGVRKFLDDTLDEVRRSGIVRTLSGRLRRIPDIKSRDFNARGFAERTAFNTPLQGSAADLVKLAMIHLHRSLKDAALRARMILQVHDELVLEVPKGEVERAITLVREAMERVPQQVYELKVPIVTSVSIGPNWRDMTEL